MIFYNTLHDPRLRLLGCLVGELVLALAFGLFIAPLGLYTGGLLGVCQLIRTLLVTHLALDFGETDIAGILYFLANLPILAISWKIVGRQFAAKTAICVGAYTLFYSLIPVPETPIIEDYLTACLLGGIIAGAGSGIVLTCGGSGGGLDMVGACLSKKGSRMSIGRFAITFNVFLYAIFLLIFNPMVTIYSVIYNFTTSSLVDRVHQQNVNEQILIVTRQDPKVLSDYIINQLHRSTTIWDAVGGYSGNQEHILSVCLSKYETEEFLHNIRKLDPRAFVTVQEGVHVYGNFHHQVG